MLHQMLRSKLISSLSWLGSARDRARSSSADGHPHHLRWLLATAGGSIALALACSRDDAMNLLLQTAHGEGDPKSTVQGRLREWLKAQGADVGLVDIRESQVGPWSSRTLANPESVAVWANKGL